ncbi:hypothetical protein jhhlp_008203 [Lomentospora prolificans]|uniref:alpha-glucosidase n=1 Tax=Lomentospora prolificans TaxID=41688 RepID=A0A2N3MZA2_9PEZI|nr:hypothetical protein jhhlp_008203 [Lomentospora prolificans]
MDKYVFQCAPVAEAESIVSGPQYRFTVLDDRVLRFEWSADGVFEDRASTFAINRKFPKPDFHVKDGKDQLEIITSSFHLTYDKQRFSPNGLVVTFTSKQTDWGGEWRYGSPLKDNLGGTARTLDWTDGRCDMGHGILSKAGFASLDDSASMLFDGSGFVTPRRPGDRIDGYLFHYGHDFRAAMRSYYAISGSQPVVPRWALGNWWSRYYAYSAEEYLSLMDQFRSDNIPLSVAVVDMDWHVVKGDHVPHVGWTGYTWNRDLFPDPESFTQALHARGLKVTLNDHPHAGIHHHEDVYEELARVLGHDTTNRAPILFDPTSPKFMHAYFNVVHRRLEEQGCDFWWIDWQQGPYTRIPGIDPLWLLNHFQFLDLERKGTGDALVFSRYAGPGSHRYPVGFSGDTHMTWASLEFQPEFTATASNIGYGWWSHDIGGHMEGYRDDELAARWVQFGAFSPILRLHSSNSLWTSKEPWRYRPESEAAMKEFMQLRHRLVPYIYTMNATSPALGLPLIQPLYWNFPSRDIAYRFPKQYYFGSSLVVAPVVTPRDRKTNYAETNVWVPPGRHVDILTGSVYDGDREIVMYRPLHRIPVLAPEGAIIPLDRERVPANGCANPSAFEVIVVVGRDGHLDILEDTSDDHERQSPGSDPRTLRSISIDYNQADGRLTAESAGKGWTFRFIALSASSRSDLRVLVDGVVSTEAEVSAEDLPHRPSIAVSVPSIPNVKSTITVELGPDPQLATLNYASTFATMLADFQMENRLKDRIWEVLEASQPTAVKIGRLLSLGLEKSVVGPLMELILSDSRSQHGGCLLLGKGK